MTDILEIPQENLVAMGGQREVYRHPTDPKRLIKVLRSAAQMGRRNTFSGVTERWFPETRIRQVRKEYSEYLRLMLASATQEMRLPIAHMQGFVTTNRGLGCVTQAVMQADGSLGETLQRKINTEALSDADLALFNDAVARIYDYGIRASDMNSQNFVFGQRDNGAGLGAYECVLVDGFGDIHAIPTRSMAQWSNRLGLDDSARRLARNTGLVLDPKTRAFSRA